MRTNVYTIPAAIAAGIVTVTYGIGNEAWLMNRHPMFCDMQNMMESMMFGKKLENLLDDGSGQNGMGMYCLTVSGSKFAE